jgi:molybdate transport system regulatory protein
MNVMTKRGNKTTGARLRIVLRPDVALGPGKAALLQGIQETGSIAAAGRRMKMSYKRAWSLIEELNQDFGTALVATSKGGKSFGGATLTETGSRVLSLYRSMEQHTRESIQEELHALQSLLPDSAE